MKKIIQHLALATLFIIPVKIYCASNTAAVAPLLQFRSQGQDVARDLAGMTQIVNLFDQDCINGTVCMTAEYTRSFRPQRLAQQLFGRAFCDTNCSGAIINVSGSRVANRGPRDWLADNFYLPTDFQSTLKFSPRIANVVIDMSGYIGLDSVAQGLFVRLDAPFAWTRWDLHYCEVVTSTGGNPTDDGYMSCSPIERTKLLTNFSQFANGQAPAQFNDSSFPADTITFDGLCNAKIQNCSHSLATLADLSLVVGYNFVERQKYHFGAGAKVVAPTGNRPEGKYLFEPIVGNGKHWELGAYFTGHAQLWECQDEDASFGLYIDATLTHLFKTRQRRTADLINRPLSRYMLAEKFTTPAVGLTGGALSASAIVPSAQFAREFTPIANLTTQDVQVSIGVQGDIAAQFTYVQAGWNWDIGYNFWGRSCERFSSCSTDCSSSSNCASTCSSSSNCPTQFAQNTWGVKGDAYVFGFPALGGGGVGCTALSATENTATINAGTNFAATGASSSTLVAAGEPNPGVDTKQLAWTSVGGTQIFAADGVTQINTSIDPILIKKSDFDFAGTRGYSHKLYTHVNYQWVDVCYKPYVGIGGFGEFGSNGGCVSSCSAASAATPCSSNSASSSCVNAALSQWGVWAKFGLAFN